jgi:two-component system, OmpR family, sensor histidine kinase RstB
MTWLFVRFYLCVLIVLFLAWFINGTVLKWRTEADTERVVVTAHRGGARLVAAELDAAASNPREQVLKGLRARFAYPLEVVALTDLPGAIQRAIRNGEDVTCFRLEGGYCVVSVLSGGTEVVRLGPFPNYDLRQIEDSIGGWMRLAADRLDTAASDRRGVVLKELQERFDFPVDIASCEELPDWPKVRLRRGETIVFYPQDPRVKDRWLAVTPLIDRAKVVRFGPFPSFERIDQKAAGTTLALVLLPVALAIALLLRPVAWQLRYVERAAKTIASGDLTARVDERRVRSARSLAQAFNDMAGRTETMVRTQRELLQAVSHELRTPLSRLRFAIGLIEAAKDDGERKQWLEALDAATEELDELVGELLSYVRMETGQPKVELEPIALRDILETLLPKHAALYPAIKFEVDESVGVDQVVAAERAGLQRVLGNLLSNAGRFAKSRVTISTMSVDRATIVDIDDDGDGIPESERERVFQPFVRLQDDSSDRGIGLGLALVKRIVAQHGGTAEALTSPLGGCRIRTIWPVRD